MDLVTLIEEAIVHRVPDYVMFVGLAFGLLVVWRATASARTSANDVASTALKTANEAVTKSHEIAIEMRAAHTALTTQLTTLQIELARNSPTREEVRMQFKEVTQMWQQSLDSIQSQLSRLTDALIQRGT